MLVVILKTGKVTLFCIGVALLILGGVSGLWFWLNEPYPPPNIGVVSSSTVLAEQLFHSAQIGEIHRDSTEELLAQLASDEIDYILELDEPTPGTISVPIGQLVPAIIIPYFDQTEGISLHELTTVLEMHPDQVVVSDTLALPGFPWSSRPVTYLPSSDIVDQLTKRQARFGIVPLQHRSPAVRVLPLDGVDPRISPAENSGSYPLNRSLHLSRNERTWIKRLKDRYTQYKGGTVDEIHLAPRRSAYANPWGHQIQLLAAGDVMLDRDVEKVGLERGWEYIFDEVASVIRQADLAFANLESPVGDKGHFINMFQAPPEAIKGIVHAGFDVVSLANNHTLDYHHDGMFETMRLLDEHEVDWVGAGRDIYEARQPLIKEVDDVRVGFLSYTEMWFVHAREPISWKATEDEPGVAPAEIDYVIEDVMKLRDSVDVVIVTVHWGKEYTHEPTMEQQKLARAAVDAGADLVLGHHPHVLQGIEFYRDGVIAYSLGNFVFDLNLPRTWETMMLQFTLSTSGILDMTIVPTFIYGVQPRVLEGNRREALYRRIRDFSLSD